MAQQHILLTALGISLAVTLGACATHRTPPPALATMVTEVSEANRELPCDWTVAPDPMYPAKGQAFTCVGGTFSGVLLFIDPAKEKTEDNRQKLKQIRLLWKEWKPEYHVADEKADASKFLAYVAHRYLPGDQATKLVDMFFGKQDKTMSSPYFKVNYQYREQPALYLHRLELVQKDSTAEWSPDFAGKGSLADQPDSVIDSAALQVSPLKK